VAKKICGGQGNEEPNHSGCTADIRRFDCRFTNDCSGEIDNVRDALNDPVAYSELNGFSEPDGFCWDNLAEDHKSEYFGKKVCDGLNKKLDDADAKIEQHKITDAAKKLTDFQNALDGLRFKAPGKEIITDAEYNKVNNPLANARSCVDSLL
jgi:hypothetical protein